MMPMFSNSVMHMFSNPVMRMFSNPVMFESVLSFFVQCKRHEITLMNEVRHRTGMGPSTYVVPVLHSI